MSCPNPCDHCLNGNGHLCTAVGCYRCTCGCRDRLPGVSATEHRPTGASQSGPRLDTLRVEP